MNKKKRYLEIWNTPTWPSRDEWKEVLGEAVQNIGAALWEPGMFFKGAADNDLKELTRVFPRELNRHSTHPIYILNRNANLGHVLCPCTSKQQKNADYIVQGCKLRYTGHVMDRNSYLLKWLEFRLPRNSSAFEGLYYMGIVPEECITRN